MEIMENMRRALALALALFSLAAFAQDEPEEPEAPRKFAVHVSGASEAGINKSLGDKLLAAITQSGKYAEIVDPDAFRRELSQGGESGTAQAVQAARRHGADFVCSVSLTEAFGEYSISARIIRVSDSQPIRAATLDRSLKSLHDLTLASNELVRQLLHQQPASQDPPPSAPAPPAPASPAASAAPSAKKECSEPFSIDELVFKAKNAFPKQLKDCSATLAKNMALAASPFGKKTAQQEPKAFMTECVIDGVKRQLPAGAEEYIKPIQGFIQNILSAASAAGGGLDVKKLSGAIGGMDIGKLMDELEAKAANDECATDEPWEADEADDDDGDEQARKGGRKVFSLGLRSGMNLSHLAVGDASYESTSGFQLGLAFDFAASEVFHIQPGLMYMQKGAQDRDGTAVTLHYLEVPLLFSLKFSAFRINAGPYFGISFDDSEDCSDFGISAGLGFDIGMFYIGVFYDYGLTQVYDYDWKYPRDYYRNYNRTIGLNLGVNL